jgi:O-antigen/teichoic acid export membrane protein
MTRLARGGSYTRLAATLVVLAFVLRVGAVGLVDFHPVNDPADYLRMGKSIADHAAFPQSTLAAGPTATRAPLYPITLGGLFAVTGDSVTAARLMGALIGTIVVLLTGLIAARLWGRRAALLALGLAAVAPPLILISVTLMTETLFTALALGAIALALRVREGSSRGGALGVGALAGLATLARPNGAVLLVLALVALWGAPRLSLRAVIRPALVLLAAVVVIAPWTIRNARLLHAFVPVTTSGWITASGMFNETTRSDPRHPAAWRLPTADPEVARIIARYAPQGEIALTKQLRRHSLDFLAHHPFFPAQAEVRNLLRFAHLQDFGLAAAGWRSVGLDSSPAPVASTFFLLLLVLAVGGILAGGLRAGPWWLWATPVLLLVSVALVGTGVRYRTPADPFVILLAAFALQRLLPMRQRKAATRRTVPEDAPAESMRVRTARGTVINAAFQIGLSGLNLLRRLSVAAFLTTEEYGIWGIVISALITLTWLKAIGIVDKYIQQREADQEAAFQKAFTLELMMSGMYFVLACAALPIYALAYDRTDIILPGLVLSSSVLLNALQAPAWIAYRRMEYGLQRILTSVDPVVSIIATIGLAAAGLGYWGLVAGSVIGTVAGVAVNVAWSPYKLRLRYDRGTMKEYASFSGPLILLGVSNLLLVQGALLVATHAVNLGAVGIIGLTSGIAAFANRADSIVSLTIYPAVCRVVDHVERLREVFIKTNRVALMWAMPFATGLALFAGDFVRFVLGAGWHDAVPLLAVVALSCGFGQLAFNWSVFMRALNHTRPLLTGSLVNTVVFLAAATPAMFIWGLNGYLAGTVLSTAAQIAVRRYYIRKMLGNFSVLRQLLRAVAPVIPGTLIVLAGRAIDSQASTLPQVIAEVVVFADVTVMCTFWFERPLVTELLGYLRGRANTPASPVGA